MNDLQPYPAYQETDIPWLGQVPAHWEIERLGAVLRERGENNADGKNDYVLSVMKNRGVIPYAEKGNVGNKKSEDITRYKLVKPDDIVMNSMNIIIGSVGISKYDGCLSPVYYVLVRRNQKDNPHYLNAYFQMKPFQESLVRLGNGILAHRMRIPMEKLKADPFPLPPPEEQDAIARYLDWADGRIRRLIRARQKQIKLLEEHKQVIIQQAVTGQIDVSTGKPYSAYKDSGVAWLGQVPEHWDVLPIKRAFMSMDYGISESSTDDGIFRLLTMGNISNGQVSIPKDGGVKTVDPFYILEPGDLLFNRTNSAELVGKVGLFLGSNTPVTFASYLVRLRPKLDNEPEYLNFVLNTVSMLATARREAIPSLHQSNLNPTRYGRLKICLPSHTEQKKILVELKKELSGIEQLLLDAYHAIDLLQEYRTRLIADVVTGKVDVRQAAERLPALEEELEEAWEEDEAEDEEVFEEADDAE